MAECKVHPHNGLCIECGGSPRHGTATCGDEPKSKDGIDHTPLPDHDDVRIHTKTVVVSAAIRCAKIDTVFCGVRHGDGFMISQMKAVVNADGGNWHDVLGFQEQGFVDNRYNFLTREEAMKVAKEAGQTICIRGCGGSTTTLYSEGLY